MSAINLAGLLIYRISPRKPIEYLLLNDSYEHHRHWYPPKGKRVGSEDELKCALRETLDLTGLSVNDLITDEAFSAELQYVDGIKPKQVVYFLARLASPSRHGAIRCDGAGLKYQWCALDQALERTVFQSMQNILTQAEDYIEGMRDEILSSGLRSRRQYNNSDGASTDNRPSEYDEGGANTWRSLRGDASGVESRFKRMSLNDVQRGGRAYADHGQQQQQQQQQRQPQQPMQGEWKEMLGGGIRDGTGAPQQRRPQDNPLYKTRLCEKFELDGECPYNQKCVFAHGAAELRARETAPAPAFRSNMDDRQREYTNTAPPYQQQHQQEPSQQRFQQHRQFQLQPPQFQQPLLSPQFQLSPRTPQSSSMKFAPNPLYKTRLCQRFGEQGDCPYGEKCQFAHGETELRVAPEQPVMAKPLRDVQYPPRTPTDPSSSGFSRSPFGSTQVWRKDHLDSSAERGYVPRLAKNMSWSNTGARLVGESSSIGDDSAIETRGYMRSGQSPNDMSANGGEFKAPLAAPLNTPAPQKIPTQASTKTASVNMPSAAGTAAKKSQEPKSGSFRGESGGERPWIKVVEISNKELRHMGSPLGDTAAADAAKQKQVSKVAELESRLTKELADFFATSSVKSGQEPTLQIALKEITHIEFRNNLTKQQLLNICIAALFAPCKGLGVSDAIAKNCELLSKIVVKQHDQVFMLNAWLRLLTEGEDAAAWQKKASELLGALYTKSLLDEEVFTQWFEGKQRMDCDSAIASMQAFAHWLATAEEE